VRSTSNEHESGRPDFQSYGMSMKTRTLLLSIVVIASAALLSVVGTTVAGASPSRAQAVATTAPIPPRGCTGSGTFYPCGPMPGVSVRLGHPSLVKRGAKVTFSGRMTEWLSI
jgi:hypothetical protein